MPCYMPLMSIGDKIREAREAAGLSQAALAHAAGITQPTIAQLESGDSKTTKHIFKIARALGVSPSKLDPTIPVAKPATVPLVGYVGAGSAATYFSLADSPDEQVPMPPGGTENTVAVEIRGTSLGSMFDRWLVFYDEIRTPPSPSMYRKLCVVGLADGRVLVKKIIPGSKRGLYHLDSQTEGMLEDQSVEWCALVRAMMPK